jgi:SAM-dependent methyltransferase
VTDLVRRESDTSEKGLVAVGEHVETHYAQIASRYNGSWSTRPAYVSWMSTEIAKRLRVSSGGRIADIGAGTGLFLRSLIEHASASTPVLCIDPSAEMLDLLPQDPRLRPILASAEEVAAGTAALPYDQFDAILIKEAIHHVEDVSGTVRGLAHRLAPGGRLLVVTLPPLLDYPLFQAALDRFATRQPEPTSIADAMRAAGLETDYGVEEVPVVADRDQYIDLVGNRWMSVLSTFTDEELATGIDEMRERYPQRELRFVDRIAFVSGIR